MTRRTGSQRLGREIGWVPSGVPTERSVLPADVLATAFRADATRPRLTFYDDAVGPTRGERIELSAKVLSNWVAKAANALQEDLDVTPGSRVLLDLPLHWRAVYWALAVWSVGATLVLPGAGDRAPSNRAPSNRAPSTGTVADLGGDIALVVSDDVAVVAGARSSGTGAVLVSLPMLARGHLDTPGGVFDEARELATYGDVFDAWESPSPAAVALVGAAGVAAGPAAYGALVVPRPEWGDRPRVELAGTLDRVLVDALSAWYADGSVVLVRDPDGEQQARRTSEGVTVRLSGG